MLALLFQQNLAGGTTVNLAGSASAVSTAAGVLGNAIHLASTALASATATGALSMTGALAGNAVDQASATGALTLAINLAGAAQAQASGNGSLSTASSLAGSAAAIASAFATLSTGTGLSGAASALATAAASLAQAIALSGTAQGSVSAAAALTVSAAFSAASDPARTLQVSEYLSTGGAYRAQPDGIPIILHSPVAVLDYTIDWQARQWLQPGETIVSQTVTADAGISVAATNLLPAYSAASVQIWLAGGVAGSTYLVTCQIRTSTGRVDERSFRLMVMLR